MAINWMKARKASNVVQMVREGEGTRRLKAFREAFIHYHQNPADYLDYDNIILPNSYCDYAQVPMKEMETVLGIEELGSGAYSRVYSFDSKRVLKIVRSTDEGYERFVRLIKKNPNPHFPRVFYSGDWAGKRVYLLERLSDDPKTLDHSIKYDFIGAIERGAGNPFLRIADENIARAAELLKQNNLLNDLHAGNVMFRGDVPIITDPAC